MPKKTPNRMHKKASEKAPVACATHNGPSEASVTEEKPASPASTAIVRATPVLKGGAIKPWKWTRTKRLAMKMALNGAGPVEIADKVGKHRNTVRNWTNRPEWIAELERLVRESQVFTKLRRINTTGAITDRLAFKALKALQNEDKVDTVQAGLFLREHASYARLEREMYGESVGGGVAKGAVNITLNGGQPQADVKADTTASIAFRDFMAEHDESLFSGVVIDAPNPQAALVEATRTLLQESTLLDKVHEEDRAQLQAEAEAEAAAKRKR